MTIDVKNAAGATQTVQSLDDLSKNAGAADATTLRQVVASNDAQFGGVTETAPATDTASSGLNGRLQRLAQRMTSLIGLFPTSIGQKAAAGSLSVTNASDDAILGATNETAPASDTAAAGHNGRLQRIAQRLTSLIALLPSSIGQKNTAGSLSVAIASDDAAIGIVTESAPASDTASSGINGRLQRIAQRLTSILGVLDYSQLYVGGASLTPKFAVISASSLGANTIVSGVASKKIRVIAVWLTANGTVNAKWQSATTPTDKTGLAYLVANAGYVLPHNPLGWFETIAGEALSLNLSAAIAVGGSIVYVEV